jgi:hypothetical protein
MSYYEKWAAASAAIAIERGTFTHAELDAQMGPDPATLDNQARYKFNQNATQPEYLDRAGVSAAHVWL